jgi:hypothetical protein
MNQLKYLISCIGLLATFSFTHAQSFVDALRYSDYDYIGTARSVGVNGSMNALGAEFSSMHVNPAGIGMYRLSAIGLSPSFSFTNIKSKLEGQGNGFNERTNELFTIQNAAGVFVNRPANSDFKTANFGISFQRLANFNQEFFFEGFSQGSIVNRFQEIANSTGLDEFEAGLAFDAGALYDLEDDGVFESDVELAPESNLYRRQDIFREGQLNELQFTIGGNIQEKLIVGFAVGIPFLEYSEEKVYFESDNNDEIPFYESIEFFERLTTTGVGVNAKLGIIYRINQMFRVSGSVHTPTAWSLDDSFITDVRYQYVEDDEAFDNLAQSPEGVYEYRLSTPWRFNAGLGAIIDKSGFITASVEIVNFAGNQLKFPDVPQDEAFVNNEIQSTLKTVVNARIGGEYAVNKFRFRGGVGLHPSALSDDNTFNYSFGLGAGYRGNRFFAELGYHNNRRQENYLPYVTNQGPLQIVENEYIQNRLVLSFGLRL